MIIISDLSRSYIKEVATLEAMNVVGGFYDFDSYNFKSSDVDITQLNIASIASYNIVGSVNTSQ